MKKFMKFKGHKLISTTSKRLLYSGDGVKIVTLISEAEIDTNI